MVISNENSIVVPIEVEPTNVRGNCLIERVWEVLLFGLNLARKLKSVFWDVYFLVWKWKVEDKCVWPGRIEEL